MTANLDESSVHTKMRRRAEAQLKTGAIPTASYGSLGVDALRLLHRMSSNPYKAGDALKLLHELQVHQVELDLQNETIAANEQAVEEDLELYRAFYDCAPFGYFVVDLQGMIIQGNLAAAELFGVDLDDLDGQSIDTFLPPQNRPLVQGLLERVAQSGARESCVARTLLLASGGAQVSRQLQFTASTPAGREHILLACCECAKAE